jgi:hypothetical protein
MKFMPGRSFLPASLGPHSDVGAKIHKWHKQEELKLGYKENVNWFNFFTAISWDWARRCM